MLLSSLRDANVAIFIKHPYYIFIQPALCELVQRFCGFPRKIYFNRKLNHLPNAN